MTNSTGDDMKSRTDVLGKMMEVLVKEWGYDQVHRALTHNGDDGITASSRKDGRRKAHAVRVKPTAMEQVSRINADMEQLGPLSELAARYDRRQFLPSVIDVREFLIMMGVRPPALKDRSEAFRMLLRNLVLLPRDQLERLARSDIHSGPSELAPLSDAIASAAQQLRRPQQEFKN